MSTITLEELLEAGAHFGHLKGKVNPKMKPYIFTMRNNVHIINIEETKILFDKALIFLKKMLSDNKLILFVGTKRQAKNAVEKLANSLNMPLVVTRWLGGTLTNFDTIQKSLKRLNDLNNEMKSEDLEQKYTKKEIGLKEKECAKLVHDVGGLTLLNKLPDAIFLVDPVSEKTAVAEARNLNIPIVAILDTNADPQMIDYPIPANDEAVKTINLLCTVLEKELKSKPKKDKDDKK
jgi:small subunit ribosomal protein S2